MLLYLYISLSLSPSYRYQPTIMGNLNANLVLLMLALLLSALPLKGHPSHLIWCLFQISSLSFSCNIIYGLISRCTYAGASNTDEYIPVTPVKYLTLANVPGGVLAGYNQCSDCRCCSTNNPSNCVTTKCCYKLICHEATNPAAICSYRPVACHCDNCIWGHALFRRCRLEWLKDDFGPAWFMYPLIKVAASIYGKEWQ